MKVTLKDGAPRHVGHVEINASKNGNTLEIGALGVDPAPIVLEFYGGKLVLRLFGPDMLPTVVQEISTVPSVAKAEAAVAVAGPSLLKPVSSATDSTPRPAPVAAPAADFDEAAFDAA